MPIKTEDILQWLRQLAQVLQEKRDYLTQLDSAIGDADHGINMDRGFRMVLEKLQKQTETDIGSLFKLVGMTLVSTVGGASGPLYGTAFLRASAVLAGKQELSGSDYVALLAAAVDGIQARGKARAGEKTMLDALLPALASAREAEAAQLDIVEMTRRASDAAERGAQATIPLLATKGRASYLGERSIGHQDPGATSSWLLLRTLADVCAERSGQA